MEAAGVSHSLCVQPCRLLLPLLLLLMMTRRRRRRRRRRRSCCFDCCEPSALICFNQCAPAYSSERGDYGMAWQPGCAVLYGPILCV
jgi:hypothetical protein